MGATPGPLAGVLLPEVNYRRSHWLRCTTLGGSNSFRGDRNGDPPGEPPAVYAGQSALLPPWGDRGDQHRSPTRYEAVPLLHVQPPHITHIWGAVAVCPPSIPPGPRKRQHKPCSAPGFYRGVAGLPI